MSIKSTDTKTNQYKVTWQEYNKDIHKLANLIKNKKLDKISGIIGILRGSLTISHHLSHLLNLPVVHLISPFSTQILPTSLPIKTTFLLVDEVSDTGITLTEIINNLQKAQVNLVTATLHIKSHTTYFPDFWIKKIDKWIQYPWEV